MRNFELTNCSQAKLNPGYLIGCRICRACTIVRSMFFKLSWKPYSGQFRSFMKKGYVENIEQKLEEQFVVEIVNVVVVLLGQHNDHGSQYLLQ